MKTTKAVQTMLDTLKIAVHRELDYVAAKARLACGLGDNVVESLQQALVRYLDEVQSLTTPGFKYSISTVSEGTSTLILVSWSCRLHQGAKTETYELKVHE